MRYADHYRQTTKEHIVSEAVNLQLAHTGYIARGEQWKNVNR